MRPPDRMPAGHATLARVVGLLPTGEQQHRLRVGRALGVRLGHRVPLAAVRAAHRGTAKDTDFRHT